MQKILVKVHNSKKTIAETAVITKDGVPTTIKANKRVNYEFFDQDANHAPHHIVTKRVDKDLHVSFETEGKESDLIIEGFYDTINPALIGLAEDGQYYYYVPDTGNVADYVANLAIDDSEGQALGGDPYMVPWWVGEASGVGLLPLLGVLVGVAGIAAIKNDDKDGLVGGADNGNPTPTPTPTPTPIIVPKPEVVADNGGATVTPSANPHDCVIIDYTDESGVAKTIVIEKDKTADTWLVNTTKSTVTVETVTKNDTTPFLDIKTGVVTLPALAVKDNSDVFAYHKLDDTYGDKVDVMVGVNSISTPIPTPTPKPQPALKPAAFTDVPNGVVSFALVKETIAAKATVTVTAHGITKDVVFTKEADGAWKTEDTTIGNWSVEPNYMLSVRDAQSGQLVNDVPAVRFFIPANEVEDNSRVWVTVTDVNNTQLYREFDNAGQGGDEANDIVPPTLMLAGTSTGDALELIYNETLDAVNVPEVERFVVQVDGQSIAINGVQINDNKVTIALKDPVVQGQIIKVSYNDPTTNNDPTQTNGKNPLQDVAGNDVDSFSTELTVGTYLAKSDKIDFGLVGDVNIVDLSVMDKVVLQNVTLANVTKSNNDGLFIKGDVGDTIMLGTVLDAGSASIQADGAGQWKKDGITNSAVAGDTNQYNIWMHTNGAMLYIDTDIIVL